MLVSATSNPDKIYRLGKTTEYQLYSPSSETVIDFTERKLRKFIETAKPADRITATVVLDDYKKCKLAVGWNSGRPVWIRIKSEIG